MRILLVDDEYLVLKSVARLLRFKGHDVVTILGGADAYAFLRDGGKVDLVISDVEMPGFSGHELKNWIDITIKVPTILHSGNPSRGVLLKGNIDVLLRAVENQEGLNKVRELS